MDSSSNSKVSSQQVRKIAVSEASCNFNRGNLWRWSTQGQVLYCCSTTGMEKMREAVNFTITPSLKTKLNLTTRGDKTRLNRTTAPRDWTRHSVACLPNVTLWLWLLRKLTARDHAMTLNMLTKPSSMKIKTKIKKCRSLWTEISAIWSLIRNSRIQRRWTRVRARIV